MYLLCICIAVVFIYITHNSSMRCFDFLYEWIDCVFSGFMCVCPTTRNSDLPQLPCQVNSLDHWKCRFHKPNIYMLILFSIYRLENVISADYFIAKIFGVSDIYSNNTTFLHLIFLWYFNDFMSYLLKCFSSKVLMLITHNSWLFMLWPPLSIKLWSNEF